MPSKSIWIYDVKSKKYTCILWEITFFFIMDIGRFIHYKIDIKVIDKEHSAIIDKFQECFTDIDEKKKIYLMF